MIDDNSVTNSELIHQWFEQVWNQRDESALLRLMAPDAKVHGVGDAPVNRDGFRKGWVGFIETFPDIQVVVENVVSERDMSAARITVTGTHLGLGLGVQPTGKFVIFEAHIMCRWLNGQIIEGWNVIDMVSVYRQIGATKL